MRRNFSLLFLLLCTTGTSLAWQPSQAAMIYLVSASGQGVVEAEHFDTKVDNPAPESWDLFSSPTSGPFANASGGQYIQALPDDGTSHSVGGTPYVEYVFRVPNNPTAFGNYLLYFRAVGPNTGGDSLFWRVFKASDSSIVASQGGAGVPVGGSASAPWDTGAWNTTVTTIPVSTADDYIVRVTPREDGVAIDKLSFQLDTLPAPTNFGPAESPLFAETVPIPEPSTGLLLLCGILLPARRIRNRSHNHPKA